MPITQLVWGQNIPQEMMVHSKFFFCFFKDFISLTEIETASERGNTSRGVGEEEAGSQQRSLMRGSIPEHWDHALSQRQTLDD